ncbi:hypothetical protein H9P43_002921 [Blastocladiella emersonii ATCC 22665]|nr:hypothetical protein H9P43_002921 [Blastocladiella emersonii ATCC 22665]
MPGDAKPVATTVSFAGVIEKLSPDACKTALSIHNLIMSDEKKPLHDLTKKFRSIIALQTGITDLEWIALFSNFTVNDYEDDLEAWCSAQTKPIKVNHALDYLLSLHDPAGDSISPEEFTKYLDNMPKVSLRESKTVLTEAINRFQKVNHERLNNTMSRKWKSLVLATVPSDLHLQFMGDLNKGTQSFAEFARALRASMVKMPASTLDDFARFVHNKQNLAAAAAVAAPALPAPAATVAPPSAIKAANLPDVRDAAIESLTKQVEKLALNVAQIHGHQYQYGHGHQYAVHAAACGPPYAGSRECFYCAAPDHQKNQCRLMQLDLDAGLVALSENGFMMSALSRRSLPVGNNPSARKSVHKEWSRYCQVNVEDFQMPTPLSPNIFGPHGKGLPTGSSLRHSVKSLMIIEPTNVAETAKPVGALNPFVHQLAIIEEYEVNVDLSREARVSVGDMADINRRGDPNFCWLVRADGSDEAFFYVEAKTQTQSATSSAAYRKPAAYITRKKLVPAPKVGNVPDFDSGVDAPEPTRSSPRPQLPASLAAPARPVVEGKLAAAAEPPIAGNTVRVIDTALVQAFLKLCAAVLNKTSAKRLEELFSNPTVIAGLVALHGHDAHDPAHGPGDVVVQAHGPGNVVVQANVVQRSISTGNIVSANCNYVRIVIDGTEIMALVDLGAKINVMSAAVASRLNLVLDGATASVQGVGDGPAVRARSAGSANVSIASVDRDLSFYVLDNPSNHCILGMPFFHTFRVHTGFKFGSTTATLHVTNNNGDLVQVPCDSFTKKAVVCLETILDSMPDTAKNTAVKLYNQFVLGEKALCAIQWIAVFNFFTESKFKANINSWIASQMGDDLIASEVYGKYLYDLPRSDFKKTKTVLTEILNKLQKVDCKHVSVHETRDWKLLVLASAPNKLQMQFHNDLIKDNQTFAEFVRAVRTAILAKPTMALNSLSRRTRGKDASSVAPAAVVKTPADAAPAIAKAANPPAADRDAAIESLTKQINNLTINLAQIRGGQYQSGHGHHHGHGHQYAVHAAAHEPRSPPQGCFYCDVPGHRKTKCQLLQLDVNAGLVAVNDRGYILLVLGGRFSISNSHPGRRSVLKEWAAYYHVDIKDFKLLTPTSPKVFGPHGKGLPPVQGRQHLVKSVICIEAPKELDVAPGDGACVQHLMIDGEQNTVIDYNSKVRILFEEATAINCDGDPRFCFLISSNGNEQALFYVEAKMQTRSTTAKATASGKPATAAAKDKTTSREKLVPVRTVKARGVTKKSKEAPASQDARKLEQAAVKRVVEVVPARTNASALLPLGEMAFHRVPTGASHLPLLSFPRVHVPHATAAAPQPRELINVLDSDSDINIDDASPAFPSLPPSVGPPRTSPLAPVLACAAAVKPPHGSYKTVRSYNEPLVEDLSNIFAAAASTDPAKRVRLLAKNRIFKAGVLAIHGRPTRVKVDPAPAAVTQTNVVQRSIATGNIVLANCANVRVKINDVELVALVNQGAKINVLSAETAAALNIVEDGSGTAIKGIGDGPPVKARSVGLVHASVAGVAKDLIFFIVDKPGNHCILGMPFFHQFGVNTDFSNGEPVPTMHIVNHNSTFVHVPVNTLPTAR